MLASKRPHKQAQFDADLLNTVRAMQRKVIPKDRFWDEVAARLDAPVSKCVLVYNRLQKYNMTMQTPKRELQTLEQHVLLTDDFDVSGVQTQPERTIKIVVNDDSNSENFYVRPQTVDQIPYFKDMKIDGSCEICIQGNCSTIQ